MPKAATDAKIHEKFSTILQIREKTDSISQEMSRIS